MHSSVERVIFKNSQRNLQLCPSDVVTSSGTVCRVSIESQCDLQEICNGTTNVGVMVAKLSLLVEPSEWDTVPSTCNQGLLGKCTVKLASELIQDEKFTNAS